MKHHVFFLILLPSTLYGLLDFGSKTYVALPQYDAQRCQETALWHTHTTMDVGNPLGISLQLVPFFSTMIQASTTAKALTLQESGTLVIMSDRFGDHTNAVLPYHAIVHNPTTNPPEYNATLTLLPSFTALGTTTTLFYDARDSFPGFSCSALMPLYYVWATLMQSGGTATMEQYFTGIFSQATPTQAALKSGLLGKHKHLVFGPLDLIIRYTALESPHNYVTPFIGVGITLQQRPQQTYLFDYISTTYGHHSLIAGFDTGATLFQDEVFMSEIIFQTHYTYLFGGDESRILSVLNDDGSIPAYGYYLLGAEINKKGVFPLANILQQLVHRSSTHAFDLSCLLAVTWQDFTGNIGYEFFCRQAERITVLNWPNTSYAIASPLYNTTTTFTDAASQATVDGASPSSDDPLILLSNRLLTQDMINTEPAESHALAGMRLTLGIGINTTLNAIPIACGIGLSYQQGLTLATPSLLGCFAKGMISF